MEESNHSIEIEAVIKRVNRLVTWLAFIAFIGGMFFGFEVKSCIQNLQDLPPLIKSESP